MEPKKIKISLVSIVVLIIVIALCLAGVVIVLLKNQERINNNFNENIIDATPTLKPNPIQEDEDNISQTNGVNVVPTMLDKISADSSWCATFQLVWNDMKNEIVKKDIVFTPQLDMVDNLNREDFKESMISDEYYYKIYGLKSLELKDRIEQGIKEKFNQTSDILDDFDWSDSGLDNPNDPNMSRYFFYTMLYRKFDFIKEFDKLEKGQFGDRYENVEYFGIDGNTKNSVGDQIEVLYYNSEDDFAILVNTKSNDEVIFCKKPQGNTFDEIYDNMNNKADEYQGNHNFKDIDEFKAPNLSLNVKREYEELQNKPFKTATGTAEIAKAIQSIKFSINEKGGEIKSEAAIDMKLTSTVVDVSKDEPRYFYVDDTFAMFLREQGKDKPYFAGRIDDITKFQ